MKKRGQKAIVLAVGVVFVIMLIAGCEEQSVSSSRMSKLIAAENIELKEEIKQRDAAIEEQKKQLEKCQQENKIMAIQLKANSEELMGQVFENFGRDNARLRSENQELKTQIQKLQKELAELKKADAIKPQ